ncbi:unnamed protein product [Urochloa humidicola]
MAARSGGRSALLAASSGGAHVAVRARGRSGHVVRPSGHVRLLSFSTATVPRLPAPTTPIPTGHAALQWPSPGGWLPERLSQAQPRTTATHAVTSRTKSSTQTHTHKK